ncbi:hypothetical protein ABT090_33590 [Streptomyces asoensis]|uniref:hypothetical protein n=1 Tax=Streptomyces asoensis TaxID=249586 RepID=UPI003320D954
MKRQSPSPEGIGNVTGRQPVLNFELCDLTVRRSGQTRDDLSTSGAPATRLRGSDLAR